MDKKEVARAYVAHLGNGDMEQVLALFNSNGRVDSPLYGQKKADEFYRELNGDTANSELSLLGIFEEGTSGHIALYFKYKWTLRNHKVVKFDVVDIIEFDDQNKIAKLKIIYDTVLARQLVAEL